MEVAQFIYLILNNQKLRDVIDTITSKSVLILGRFNLPERKAVLDALRNRLREMDLVPIVFDFKGPVGKDLTETIKTLAGLSSFVIADITSPRSTPLELQATVPDFQIPFMPIMQAQRKERPAGEQGPVDERPISELRPEEKEKPFAMMRDLQGKYNWVFSVLEYDSLEGVHAKVVSDFVEPVQAAKNG